MQFAGREHGTEHRHGNAQASGGAEIEVPLPPLERQQELALLFQAVPRAEASIHEAH